MEKRLRRIRRQKRMKTKIRGTDQTPRVAVFRSNRYIYAQIIDDQKQQTVVGVSEKHIPSAKGSKVVKAKELGKLLAQKAGEKKIKKVIFDRAGYNYAGRVRALAEGAREGGLEF